MTHTRRLVLAAVSAASLRCGGSIDSADPSCDASDCVAPSTAADASADDGTPRWGDASSAVDGLTAPWGDSGGVTLDGSASRPDAMVDATSPFGFDATLPGDAGFDYLTACLGDANVLMLAGDDGFMLTGASVVTPIVSIWGAAGFDAGSDISYVSLVTDAGYGMQFNGEIYGPSLAAGDYPELDAGDGRGSRIRLTFGSSASDTRIGSDMNILALTYSATGASWTVEDFTVTFVLYGMGYGAAPDYGCAHYQQ